MRPTLRELLAGNMIALSEPPAPETLGEFMAGRIGVVGLISVLAAQEAERGAEVRVQENQAFRDLFARAAAEAWAPELASRLAEAATGSDPGLTISALDGANADLRRLFIALQSAVEAQPGTHARQLELARLLRRLAEARTLDLSALPGG